MAPTLSELFTHTKLDPTKYVKYQNVEMKDLPQEIILDIFRKLEEKDLVNVSINRQWKQLMDNENLWEILCQRDFSIFTKIAPPSIPLEVTYEDSWKKSYQLLKIGYNKITDENGTVREGIFKNGELNGRGKMTFAKGTILEGEFKNGDLNGPGKITFSDGRMWEGEFLNNELHGRGKKTLKDGTIEEGIYNQGTLMKDVQLNDQSV
jgi:hypothetical protein